MTLSPISVTARMTCAAHVRESAMACILLMLTIEQRDTRKIRRKPLRRRHDGQKHKKEVRMAKKQSLHESTRQIPAFHELLKVSSRMTGIHEAPRRLHAVACLSGISEQRTVPRPFASGNASLHNGCVTTSVEIGSGPLVLGYVHPLRARYHYSSFRYTVQKDGCRDFDGSRRLVPGRSTW